MKHVDIYLENAGKSVKKKDGNEMKYKELWQQVSDVAVGKEITFRMGTHEFSGWLQREIQHKEENKDV